MANVALVQRPILRAPVPTDVDPEVLGDVIGSLYNGVTESQPWRGALQQMLQLMDSRHVTLILRAPRIGSGGVMVNTQTVDEDATDAYQQHFFSLDPFVHLPANEVVTADQMLGSGWLQSSLYREFLKPLDVRHIMGSDLSTEGGVDCRLRFARCHQATAFSERDQALCRLLLPHLRRAVHLRAHMDRLNCEHELFAGTVNRLKLGMIHLGQDGSVRAANDEARRILGERDGLQLSGGRLSAARLSETRSLNQMLKRATTELVAGEVPGLVDAISVTRPTGRAPLGLLVRRVPGSGAADGLLRPAAVIMLRDPEASGLPAARDVVRRLFGFTPSETELALCLAEGCTLDEAADRMHVTRNTARTYLRFIFAKTGVTRQPMLVRMLLGSVVSLGAEPEPSQPLIA